MTAIEVINAHIPSLTDEVSEEIDEILIRDFYVTSATQILDYADLAIRTCHCGQRIDGFYEYVDHLKEELRKEGIA